MWILLTALAAVILALVVVVFYRAEFPHPMVRALLVVSMPPVAVLAAAVSSVSPEPMRIVVGLVFAMAVPAGIVDLSDYRIPNWVVAPTATLLATVALTLVTVGHSVFGLLAGAAFGAGLLGVVHVAQPAWMGFGDVKWMGVLGAVIGAHSVLLIPIAVMAAGVAAGMATAVMPSRLLEPVPANPGPVSGGGVGMAVRGRHIPFGPFLTLGAFIVIAATEPLLTFLGAPT